MQWYNATTGELTTNDPGAGCYGESLEERRQGWVQVSDDFRPPVSLEQAKAQKRQDINAERDQRESASPFIYLGNPFDYDAVSRERLSKAIAAATLATMNSQTFSVNWTLADNSVVTLTAQDLLGFQAAEATMSNELHIHARELKAQVEAMTTVEDVLAAPTWG